jgi:tetratricopeptide (TPR) repeat protein
MEAGERAASLWTQADALIRVRRYGEAAERAKDAAALTPHDPRPFCEWSRALYGDGQFAEAAVMADEAIRLAPLDARGFRLRSMALRSVAGQSSGPHRVGIGQEAVDSAREAVRLAPAEASGYVGLAQSLALVGLTAEADAAAQRAIRLAPGSASTWVAASLVALGAKNWNAAIDASQRALSIDANNYAALNNLGVALRASGKGRQGTEVLARAARLQPDTLTARRNLSRAGINVVRVVVLLALVPIGIVTHLGLGLYLAFAIGTNVLISRNPRVIMRLERWTAPIALLFAKHQRGPSPMPERLPEGPWSAGRGRPEVRTGVVVLAASVAWFLSLVLLAILVAPVPTGDKPWVGLFLLVSLALAVWPTRVAVRRSKVERRPLQSS